MTVDTKINKGENMELMTDFPKIECPFVRKTYGVDYDLWKAETKDWRGHICKKIDTIKSKLESLPCPDRAGKYESISRQVTFIWGILFLIVAGGITRFFK